MINVVTKSGSNQLHGTAWEFLRNDNFDARNFFLRPDQTIAPLARNQFGAAAGGRILKDRAWELCTLFDINYQPRNIRTFVVDYSRHAVQHRLAKINCRIL